MSSYRQVSRREFLQRSAAVGAAASVVGLGPVAAPLRGSSNAADFPKGNAEACIFIWLGGGCAQIDTFDPKGRGDGKKKPGCYYDTVPTAIRDVRVCEHLKRTAPLMDRVAPIRTVFHHSIDEHAVATNLMHTGRPTSGTIVYPSIGSIVAHELGAAARGVPAYVVMGYPNLTRGPGFLGAKHSYIYLTETEAGPQGLKRPDHITPDRQARREMLLGKLRDGVRGRHAADQRVQEYADVGEDALRLAGPQFMNVFDLKREPAALRESYGDEFGQRLLLSRRLVQAGVRFIEVASNLNFVNGAGWDTHTNAQLKQHELIDDLDRGFSTLLLDLEKHKLLDKTLVVIATEFGRPAAFDGGGGRGHHSKAFTCVLAGGGLSTGQAIGETDELSQKPLSQPVSVPDFFATIHCALGINPAEELYDGDRPVPITDGGQPVRELFA